MSEEMEIMEDMGAFCPNCNGLLDASQWFEGHCHGCGADWEGINDIDYEEE